MKAKLKENKGSILVEAALVFPIIILTLITTIYILIHMYQQTCLQSVVDMASEREGYYLAGTILTKDLKPENRLYYYLRDNQGILEDIEPYMDHYLRKYALSKNPKIKTRFICQLMYSQMEIMTHNTYIIPLFKSQEEKRNNETRAIYYVHDEAEYIRNADLILDEAYSGIDHIFEKAVQRSEKMEIK